MSEGDGDGEDPEDMAALQMECTVHEVLLKNQVPYRVLYEMGVATSYQRVRCTGVGGSYEYLIWSSFVAFPMCVRVNFFSRTGKPRFCRKRSCICRKAGITQLAAAYLVRKTYSESSKHLAV